MSFSCLFSKASEGVRWFPFYLFMILSSLKDDFSSFFPSIILFNTIGIRENGGKRI